MLYKFYKGGDKDKVLVKRIVREKKVKLGNQFGGIVKVEGEAIDLSFFFFS